ncbi:MAG: DUF4157 domain-containing protein [Nitrosomonas sp.]|nr:DUF4157 domain-containing protein [Nitrosomonas sp.]
MTSVAVKTRSADTAKASASIRLVSPTVSSSSSHTQIHRHMQTAAGAKPATARLSTLLSPRIQTATRISSPNDSAEREAEVTARNIIQMPAPPAPGIANQGHGIGRRAEAVSAGSSLLARSPAAHTAVSSLSAHRVIQRSAVASSTVAPDIEQAIRAEMASGMPLPQGVRSFMEPRFRADFGAVRIHTDDKAARLSARLSARAFTYGKHIFFGKGQFRPSERDGAELIAHELTHTIQQREVIQRQEAVTVTEHSPVQVQRLGIGDALNYFADHANHIPGFRMLTLILGVNPINMTRVERNVANTLRAVVELMPGGALITQALDNHGVINRIGTWVQQRIDSLGITGRTIRAAIDQFLASLSWSAVFNLSGVWNDAKQILNEPINRIRAFAERLASDVINMIKEAILTPLARLASEVRGWDLLCAVLNRNPITNAVVPRNAETLIGGFMKLINQGEVWKNIQRGNAVARAWAWFQGTLGGVRVFVQQVPVLFMQALRSLQVADIVSLPGAFVRVAGTFANFAGQFISWAGQQVLGLLTIIFEVVAPQVMVYIRRAGGALQTIIRDPMGFVRNLVNAGKRGLNQFAGNFLTHLRASLIGWLTGAMSGANIYIPQAFTLQEIVKFILSVLGLTWQNIRTKLVRVMGEPVVAGLERSFDIVITLVREGPAAAWDKIVESMTNLREMVMEQIMTFVQSRIVQAAITRLVSSLNPAGAFIQAIIATYNTVMFFVERFRQITQVVTAFIDSIATIARGDVSPAANRVEQTMGGLLTLIISFLARLVGLGNVSDAVTNVINRVRQPIDRALDRVVAWIQQRARGLASRALGGRPGAPPIERLQAGIREATAVVNRFGGRRVTAIVLRPLLVPIRARHNLQRLDVMPRGNNWYVEGMVNPTAGQSTTAQVDTSTASGNQQDGSSRDHAIEIAWVKPPVAQYPVISIINPQLVRNAQASDQTLNTDSAARITVRPTESTLLIDDVVIGVRNTTSVNLSVGYIFRARAPVTGNSKKNRMNRILNRYFGYNRTTGPGAPHDNDHVWEKQLGGTDAYENLWPLNASTNQRSGGTIRAEISRARNRLGISSLAGKWIKLRAP